MQATAKATALYAIVALAAAGSVVAAEQGQPPALTRSPQELVRRAVDNQIHAADAHYMYRLTNQRPEGTQLREMVEVSDGVVGRLIAINGQPLTAEQRQKEERRLQRLTNDPREWQNKRKQQEADDARTRKMLQALPDAFVYQYAGTEEGPYGRVVSLSFTPNPDFDPPSRETMVYRGMEGRMQILIPEDRLVLIEATLVREVNFGWGILGHLDPGGRFVVQQAPVNGDHWAITHMVLNFTGKALIFKSIKIRQDQTASDFRPIPNNLTVAQGLELLRQQDAEVAEGGKKK